MNNIDNVSTISIFPTTIITHTWEDSEKLNNELKEMIFKEAEKTPSIKFSNVGGYHSPNDALTWDYPCIKEFIS